MNKMMEGIYGGIAYWYLSPADYKIIIKISQSRARMEKATEQHLLQRTLYHVEKKIYPTPFFLMETRDPNNEKLIYCGLNCGLFEENKERAVYVTTHLSAS